MTTTREILVGNVKVATAALNTAVAVLAKFDSLAENNVYETLEKAEYAIQAKLEHEAFSDCEGAGNCGASSYTQEFMVADKKYLAILNVEYNRHDKTYYYIDGTDFSVKEI